MPPARTIIIAGAGIGGLTAALALANRGFRVVVLERERVLEGIGAGLQLSPNATRVLLSLKLGDQIIRHVVAPAEVLIRTGRGDELARVPLGDFAQQRYGAPYWVIHRGDLQNVLHNAVLDHPGITLKLDSEVDRFAVTGAGVAVHAIHGRTDITHADSISFDTHGAAFIGADGLYSSIRQGPAGKFKGSDRNDQPKYANRIAWRTTVPPSAVHHAFRAARVHLWLGRDAHLVHYPVQGGNAINIVAIIGDRRNAPDWNAKPGSSADVLKYFPRTEWSPVALEMLSASDVWLRWPLFDRPPSRRWGHGPVTLLGDAAHPMVPFLAQGAAMAIEDAAVLADCLQMTPDEPEHALRRYEDARQARTARVQRTARLNGLIYHLGGLAAIARNHTLRSLSGERLLKRFDWLYAWRPNSEPE